MQALSEVERVIRDLLVFFATTSMATGRYGRFRGPVALIWYWWTFFRDARRGPPEKPAHEIREGQRPRHPLSRPRPARWAAAREKPSIVARLVSEHARRPTP